MAQDHMLDYSSKQRSFKKARIEDSIDTFNGASNLLVDVVGCIAKETV